MTLADQAKVIAKMPLQEILKGFRGKVENRFGVNKASENDIKKRLDICRDCEFSTKNDDPKFIVNKGLTSKSRCLKCTCVILEKVKWGPSQCPLQYW